MKRRRPADISYVLRRAPVVKPATERAIDAVLGKKRAPVKPLRNLTAEVEQQFKEARHGST